MEIREKTGGRTFDLVGLTEEELALINDALTAADAGDTAGDTRNYEVFVKVNDFVVDLTPSLPEVTHAANE